MPMKARRGVKIHSGRVDLGFFTRIPKPQMPGQNVEPWNRHAMGRVSDPPAIKR